MASTSPATEVTDPFACERAVHALLAARRLNTRSELFEITAVEARSLLALLAPLAVPADETPAAMRHETDETHAPAPVVAAAFTGFRREAPSTPSTPFTPPTRMRGERACRCGRETRRETVPLSEVVAPEAKLRAWVEEHYVHVPLREKGTGTKLEALYASYFSTAPPVHTKPLGRNKFAAMLNAVYQNIGPHRNKENTVTSLYLLR